jgi:hypothetical protein
VSVEDRGLAAGAGEGRPFDPEQTEEEGLVALVAAVVERPHENKLTRGTWGEAPRTHQLPVVTASTGGAILGEEAHLHHPVAGLGEAQVEFRVVTLKDLVVADGQSRKAHPKTAHRSSLVDGSRHASLGGGGGLGSHGCGGDRGRGQLRQARGDEAGYEQHTGASATAQVSAGRCGERPAEIQA